MIPDYKKHFSGKTVLIADDERSILMSIRFFLKSFGLNVLEAEDGCQAVETIKKNNIDYVITDYRMPMMNGLELIRWIRKNHVKNNIPIIIFSGYTYDQIENHVDENTRVLYKPFIYMNLIDLLALMENIIIDKQAVQ